MKVPSRITAETQVGQLADFIRRRRLETPALIALQIVKPLGVLCGQAVVLLEPLFLDQGRERARCWAELLQDGDQIDRLEQLLATPETH